MGDGGHSTGNVYGVGDFVGTTSRRESSCHRNQQEASPFRVNEDVGLPRYHQVATATVERHGNEKMLLCTHGGVVWRVPWNSTLVKWLLGRACRCHILVLVLGL